MKEKDLQNLKFLANSHKTNCIGRLGSDTCKCSRFDIERFEYLFGKLCEKAKREFLIRDI